MDEEKWKKLIDDGEQHDCDCGERRMSASDSNALLVSDFDYEFDSTPPEKGGETLCGKLGRKHRMKRYGPMHTGCVYPGCNACQ